MRNELEKVRKMQERMFDAFHQHTVLNHAMKGASLSDLPLTHSSIVPVSLTSHVADGTMRKSCTPSRVWFQEC